MCGGVFLTNFEVLRNVITSYSNYVLFARVYVCLLACEYAHLWNTSASDEEQSDPVGKSLVTRHQRLVASHLNFGAMLLLWNSRLKARLYRRFLSRQLDAIFLALKLQLQNRTCKPRAIFSTICRRDIAGVLNMFEIWCNFAATKIVSNCRDKNRPFKWAFIQTKMKGNEIEGSHHFSSSI